MNSDRDSLYMKQRYYNKPLRRLPSSNAEQIKFSHSLRSDSDSRRTSTVNLLNPWSTDTSSSNQLTLQTKVLVPDSRPGISLRINACPNLQIDRRETIHKSQPQHQLKYLHKDFPSSPNIFDISKSSVLGEYLMVTFPAKKCFPKKMKSQIKACNQKASFSKDPQQFGGSTAINISDNCILSDQLYKEDVAVPSIDNPQKMKSLHHEYVCVSSSPIKIELESKLHDQEQKFDRSHPINYNIHFSELIKENDQHKESIPFISQSKLYDCRQNLQYASIAQPMRRNYQLEREQMMESSNQLDISFKQILCDRQEESFKNCNEIPKFKGLNSIKNDENSSLNFNKTSQQILLSIDKEVELQQHKINKEPNFKLESTLQVDKHSFTNNLQLQISTLEEIQQEKVDRSIKTEIFQLQLLKQDNENKCDQIQILSQNTIYLDDEMGGTYLCETTPLLPRITNIERNRKKLDDIKKLISRGAQRKRLDRSPEVIIQSPQISSTHQQKKNNVVPSSPTLRQPRQINQVKVDDNGHYQKNFRSVSLGKASGGKLMQMSFDTKSSLNRFKKIKYLGKGYLSDVYLVVDSRSGMIAALKMMQKSIIESKNLTNLIQNEIKIQTYLNHPNILRLYAVFNDSKQIGLLLELSGQTLFEYLKKNKLTEIEVISLAFQIISGVNYLHQQGIIHRDLKPENILINQGMVKVADFGISIHAQRSSQFCGTKGYMAPEILENGNSYDNKVDCYSVGVIIYEMLFKRLYQNQNLTGDGQLLGVLKGLLSQNPKQRISLEQALRAKVFIQCSEKIREQNQILKNTIL